MKYADYMSATKQNDPTYAILTWFVFKVCKANFLAMIRSNFELSAANKSMKYSVLYQIHSTPDADNS